MTDAMKLAMLRKIKSIELTNGRKYEVGVSIRSITCFNPTPTSSQPWFRVEGHHSLGIDVVEVNGAEVREVRYGI